MPGGRRELTRADLPKELTAESLRPLPLNALRRLSRPGNGVLDPDEQRAFDTALHEIMAETAGRVSKQINPSDWASVRRDLKTTARARSGRPSRVEEQLRRAARRIDQQVSVAEALAPGVDWSFADPDKNVPAAEPVPTDKDHTADSDHAADSDDGTVADLEARLNEQVELVQVMSEIADMSRRTFALEQQRDLQNTRGLFFGFVVSLAVLVAGWAPLVAADWDERLWVVGLSLFTCVVAGLVYALVRRWQNRQESHTDDAAGTS